MFKGSKINFIKRYFDYLIFSFFTVSICAWLAEILYSLIVRSKLVLPGTLSGPWCPIYGVTFLLLLLLVDNKDNRLYNFIKIFIIASITEYVSSYISGEIFNNVIWDYSDRFLNINGRICLEMSLIFSILGYFMMYFLEPVLRRIYISIGRKVKIINIICISLFLLDILINIFFI